MKRRIGLFIILVFTAGTVFFLSSKQISYKNNVGIVKQSLNSNSVQQPKYETFQIASNETALQLLQKTATITTNGKKESAFVTEINGRVAEISKREFWAFYVNGKQASVGAGSYYIQPNDIILWKIEKY